MKEYNVASLDGKDYIEVDTIDLNGDTYVFLVNEKDEMDYTIKKITYENDKSFYDPVDTKEEFELALLIFTKKNIDVLKDI